MVKRTTRFRLRRRLKTTKKGVAEAQAQAAEHLDRHVVRRWQKFSDVRRFVLTWLLLVGLLTAGVYAQSRALDDYYLEEVPVAGGIYTEGVVGEIDNFNPLFASTATDRTVSKLLFDSLLEYDESNNLKASLATNWQVNDEGTVYTLKLKPDVFWHDGVVFDAEDVMFTFDRIQNSDTRSPLNISWRDVEVSAPDAMTVVFTLPNPFTPFPHSLTQVGILPEHVLGEVEPFELRAHPFNLSPLVGTGPFTFDSITLGEELGQVRLLRFDLYHEGQPQLSELVINAYIDHELLINAYRNGEISAAAGLRSQDLDELGMLERSNLHQPRLFNNVGLFFNTSEAPLNDRVMRQSLTRLIDVGAVLESINYIHPISTGPLLSGQLGFDPKLKQISPNRDKALADLEAAGWKLGDDGERGKDQERLRFTLVTQNSDEYVAVANEIQRQYLEAGIVLDVLFVTPSELQQSHVVPHNYELLLYGLNQGVDPDVFPFWHSSEAGFAGFNLSEYKNTVADDSLEAGRTRTDPALRAEKYKAFIEAWRRDAPAVMLYRPTYLYVQLKVVRGFEHETMASALERHSNIEQWTIRTSLEPKSL